ncbi:Scr1 family TA system antitoxin-like transcriptional regulator [Streptomyces sp. H10-C2]|uniref:helix-turn-helix domain-containing protein n=1 Tax=unclassified Streptomyces TaxID=2593676 RepID=UPI0024B9975A|nr:MULTISPECIES: Scr1 family TA system antitoxin-like transcriptional regulator [unclassified Streptomyces]MDJ0344321.1 Scr1 family TA system antitoxin-like transcriptional regulator [Streptomyces sp. PH10-H1]MDJ0373690.1 Scr1 family TA system antitoxin-like transcriptional regulator [Streptomyces sp. H10-C2]
MNRRNGRPGSAATSGAVFGELVRDLREAAGMSQERLASRIPCDRSLIARVEAGTRVPQRSFAVSCDELLDTGGTLGRLWPRIDWHPDVAHPDWFKRRADMDAEAVGLREYQTQVIPGLLQTEDYARALFSQSRSPGPWPCRGAGRGPAESPAAISRAGRSASDGGTRREFDPSRGGESSGHAGAV